MSISKKMLKAIRAALPHGSITEIAKENEVSKSLVGKVIGGKVEINKNNIKYIIAAQKKIELWKRQQAKLEKKVARSIAK